jgi:hypothetical protein
MIQIEGLNSEQRMMADIFWSMQTQDEITAFINTLDDAQKHAAWIVLEMILAATFDQVEDINLAQDTLGRFML